MAKGGGKKKAGEETMPDQTEMIKLEKDVNKDERCFYLSHACLRIQY